MSDVIVLYRNTWYIRHASALEKWSGSWVWTPPTSNIVLWTLSAVRVIQDSLRRLTVGLKPIVYHDGVCLVHQLIVDVPRCCSLQEVKTKDVHIKQLRLPLGIWRVGKAGSRPKLSGCTKMIPCCPPPLSIGFHLTMFEQSRHDFNEVMLEIGCLNEQLGRKSVQMIQNIEENNCWA